MLRIFALLLLFFLHMHSAYANSPEPYAHWLTGQEAVYFDYHDRKERSRVSQTLHLESSGTSPTYLLTQQGRGDFDRYKQVTWEMQTVFQFRNNLPIPLSTTQTIWNDQHQTLSTLKLGYDYTKKQITVERETASPQKPLVTQFPLKGTTIDFSLLNLFLEDYSKDVTAQEPKSFYLLTCEPKLYKVNVKYVAEESLPSPWGETSAVKLRLIADMGILDEVFDRYIPPTFMWFEKNATTHRWLQYEGMETGAKSARVVIQRQN